MTGAAWLILPHFSWRFLTIVTALPVLLTCLVSMRLLPESPRWLCVQNRVSEAEEELGAAALVNNKCGAEYLAAHPIMLETEEEEALCEKEEGALLMLRELLSPQHLSVTVPLWTVWTCFGAAYYGVLLFTGHMFSSGGDDGDDDTGSCSFEYAPIFLTAVAEMLGCVLLVRFVDSRGRVTTQAVAYGMGAIGCLLMGAMRGLLFFCLPVAAVCCIRDTFCCFVRPHATFYHASLSFISA